MSDMASSSSSSLSNHPLRGKYDVFLSFRGEDTRTSFTSHLHSALNRQGIVTFIDNRLERGEEIEPAIMKAIEESHISILIISKNYATSPWCLDELVKIFECRDTQGHKVIPVFYLVDPTDVDHNETGSFGEALARHDDMEKVGKWRDVLKSAANLSGVVIAGSRPESDHIEDIVNQILKSPPNHPYHFTKLVGIQPRVSKVESLLCMGSNDVRLIGIWGMGGIGKSTIAKFIYQKYASQFHRTCFIDNVRDRNPDQLQDEILVLLLSEGNINSRLTFDMRQLRYKKVLIVLDNVDGFERIEHLAEERENWFGDGSRIIITSRDKSVFENIEDNGIYEVEALTNQEALRLFSLYAFKENRPPEDRMVLSNKVVSYAGGNPLALRVLGSLFNKKSEKEQESALKKIEKILDKKIENVLRISYDELDSHDQEIFLHIACFFIGRWSISKVVGVLDACRLGGSCESSTLIGLRVLADKSLIIMSNEKVDMHDLLQELGKHIVRQESTEPGKRTRLWDPKDIYHVLKNNTGTDRVESIHLDTSKIEKLSLPPKAFDPMHAIKLFKLYDSNVDENWFRLVTKEEFVSRRMFFPTNNVVVPVGIDYFPEELRFFQWHFYSGNSLPPNFRPGQLVEIDLTGSSVITLWTGLQDLPNLKVITLRGCKRLTNLPCLSRAPNVQIINCDKCTSLVEVCPSISCLNHLKELHLEGCIKVRSVPDTKCLTFLNAHGSGIEKFPQVPTTIKFLYVGASYIEEIPTSIRLLSQLKVLSLFRCGRLKSIPDFVFQYLKHLDFLEWPWGPFQFEKLISFLSGLKCLYLMENELKSIPACIRQMSCLKELDLSFCTRLRSLPKLPSSLQKLNTSQCTSLKVASSSLLGLEEHKGILLFGNCKSLNQDELRSILIYSQHRILSSAKNNEEFDGRMCCYTNCQYYYENCKHCDGQFVVAIPGDVIPNWIPHQNTGVSITIPLPENWFHNCLGFVLGIVFELETHQHHRSNLFLERWMMMEGHFKSNCDENLYSIYASFHYEECIIGSLHDTTNSPAEHLLLWYHKNFSLTKKDLTDSSMCQYKEVTFKIYIVDVRNRPLPSSMIKRCGVGLLYNCEKAEAEPMANRRSNRILNMTSLTLPSSSNKRCRRKDSP